MTRRLLDAIQRAAGVPMTPAHLLFFAIRLVLLYTAFVFLDPQGFEWIGVAALGIADFAGWVQRNHVPAEDPEP